MVTVTRTDEYAAWFRKLRDARAKAKILTRIDRLLDGNAGDVGLSAMGSASYGFIMGRDTEFISPIAGPR
jgi:putative addiction module killer protein